MKNLDKKEIAVMWAMRKLGYTQEQAQEVLDLANKAIYQKKKGEMQDNTILFGETL